MSSIPYRVIEHDEFHVVGEVIRVNPKNDQDLKEIGAFWKKFYTENLLEKIPHKTDRDIIAVYFDYESNHLEPYSLMIGAMVSDKDKVPENMEGITIPPSQYAVFTAEGKFPDSIINTWEHIWNSDIDRTFTYDFEIYDENFQKDDSKKKVNICISIK